MYQTNMHTPPPPLTLAPLTTEGGVIGGANGLCKPLQVPPSTTIDHESEYASFELFPTHLYPQHTVHQYY